MRGAQVTLRRFGLGAASVALAGLTGCGEDSTYKNDPRPPKTLVISAAIVGDKISVSPTSFGAGPISLTIANQTDASQRLSIVRSVNGQQQAGEQTGPINPHDTATLKADIDEGTYQIRVEGQGIEPAEIEVGSQRESAQNELLQP